MLICVSLWLYSFGTEYGSEQLWQSYAPNNQHSSDDVNDKLLTFGTSYTHHSLKADLASEIAV